MQVIRFFKSLFDSDFIIPYKDTKEMDEIAKYRKTSTNDIFNNFVFYEGVIKIALIFSRKVITSHFLKHQLFNSFSLYYQNGRKTI